ncbi:thiamine phosphate synthase [Devosia ginsengisoli]|uniref:Thiamine phosphate synthase n=1 Tax=Devosia ginsengisoli TaxID=400770 RepID=A0A5B8LUH6_9HYPH|nr:thiamine phosphate synthase [Devosia ginsengisoli]QDZ11415.1 thiamine phosphate synthase [Devosia ginsengisoli]
MSSVEYPEAMAPQLYLITPANADPASLPAALMAVLNAAEFSALLVARGDMDDATYAALAATAVNIGQGAGCAVLIEDDIALARRLGADGVHVTGDPSALKAAISALKPAMIVGAGNLHSRHDAMTAGEMDIDYVFFGRTDGKPDAQAADLAEWWAQTFEIPAVLSQPEAGPGTADSRGAEFLALSHSLWSAAAPDDAMRAIAAELGVSA